MGKKAVLVLAGDRRITLMQDDTYRMYVAKVSMGYLYPPQLSYTLKTGAP
jgi:hypothetical protein